MRYSYRLRKSSRTRICPAEFLCAHDVANAVFAVQHGVAFVRAYARVAFGCAYKGQHRAVRFTRIAAVLAPEDLESLAQAWGGPEALLSS